MYAYCANDPICCYDVHGKSVSAVAGIAGAGSAVHGIGSIIGCSILFVPIPMASSSSIGNIGSLVNLSTSEKTLINLGVKTKNKIKREKHKYDYWIAVKVTISKSEAVFIVGK